MKGYQVEIYLGDDIHIQGGKKIMLCRCSDTCHIEVAMLEWFLYIKKKTMEYVGEEDSGETVNLNLLKGSIDIKEN